MKDRVVTDSCPHCNDDLIPGKLFCPTCGLAVAPTELKTPLDAYITAKVAQEVALRLQDQTSMVREIGNKAEDVVWTRFNHYRWVVLAVVGLLGLYGFTSIKDAKQKIVDEAKGRVEPVIAGVEQRAATAQKKLDDVDRRLPEVTESLNRTSELAERQRLRIEGESADATSKLNNLQIAAQKADKLSNDFSSNLATSQNRLDSLSRNFTTQLNQISRSFAQTSISRAYPNLDQEAFSQIGEFGSLSQKKPGEKFVDIYLAGAAVSKSVISKTKFESLLLELRSSGFTPIIGLISFGGKLGGLLERVDSGPYTESDVIYFKQEFKSDAEKIAAITSKYITLPKSSPSLVFVGNNPYTAPRIMFLIKENRLDAQIFISATE